MNFLTDGTKHFKEKNKNEQREKGRSKIVVRHRVDIYQEREQCRYRANCEAEMNNSNETKGKEIMDT